jgi:hypothetical protein
MFGIGPLELLAFAGIFIVIAITITVIGAAAYKVLRRQ